MGRLEIKVRRGWPALVGLFAVLGLVTFLATVATAQDEKGGDNGWVAELGAVKDLNEKAPVPVKAMFRNDEDVLMDIEKLYVRWEQVNSKTGRWVVLSAIDTYMKCKVEYVECDGVFRDPCYGSEYDLDGHCIKGPAKDDLPDYSEYAYIEDDTLMLRRAPTE